MDELSRSYQQNASAIDSLSLPNHDAALLAHRIVAIQHDLSAWAEAGLDDHGAAFKTFVKAAQISQLADKVRADIGLPPS